MTFGMSGDAVRALVSQAEQDALQEQILATEVSNSMLSVRSAADRQTQYQLIQKLHRMQEKLQQQE